MVYTIHHVATILTLVSLSIAVDYCNIKYCVESQRNHTMCTYQNTQPSSECGNNIQLVGISEEVKQAILKKHNDLRAYVAAGHETRGSPGPQPAARSMPPLIWDDELSLIAQRWVNQCTFKHDSCRDTENYRVGQNLGMHMTTGTQTIQAEFVVQMWYDEVALFNRSEVCKFVNYLGVGHYTQLVWGDTTRIGCGHIIYTDTNGWNTYYLGCNYAPVGNVLYTPVYSSDAC